MCHALRGFEKKSDPCCRGGRRASRVGPARPRRVPRPRRQGRRHSMSERSPHLPAFEWVSRAAAMRCPAGRPPSPPWPPQAADLTWCPPKDSVWPNCDPPDWRPLGKLFQDYDRTKVTATCFLHVVTVFRKNPEDLATATPVHRSGEAGLGFRGRAFGFTPPLTARHYRPAPPGPAPPQPARDRALRFAGRHVTSSRKQDAYSNSRPRKIATPETSLVGQLGFVDTRFSPSGGPWIAFRRAELMAVPGAVDGSAMPPRRRTRVTHGTQPRASRT